MSHFPPLPDPQVVFEAVRVVGSFNEDGQVSGAGRGRVVHRVTVYTDAGRRLQQQVGGDAFNALLTVVMNCEEDPATGVLRMPGGQQRLRKLLGWGETRVVGAFKKLNEAGFLFTEQERLSTGSGARFAQTFLVPQPDLCSEGRRSHPQVLATEESGSELGSGFPSSETLGAAKPRTEPVAAGHDASGFSGSQVSGTNHEMDVDGIHSSPWHDTPAARDFSPNPQVADAAAAQAVHSAAVAQPEATPRAKAEPMGLGDLMGSLRHHSPAGGLHGPRLSPAATFEHVVDALAELGFTDPSRFASQHWKSGRLIGWINWIAVHRDQVGKPGAYLRSVMTNQRPVPDTDDDTAARPASESDPQLTVPAQRRAAGLPHSPDGQPTAFAAPAPAPAPAPAAGSADTDQTDTDGTDGDLGPTPPHAGPDQVAGVLGGLVADDLERVEALADSILGGAAAWARAAGGLGARRMLSAAQRDALWQLGLWPESGHDDQAQHSAS